MDLTSKVINAGFTLGIILLSACALAWAGAKEEVAAVGSAWGKALGEDDADKVLALYGDDAVLWGTLSPTVRADRAALRDYFVTAFSVLPALKVTFGDQLIRVYDNTAVNTRILHVLVCPKRGDQNFTCALQLHLRKERRSLAHCRSSFLSHAIGPEIALIPVGSAAIKARRYGRPLVSRSPPASRRHPLPIEAIGKGLRVFRPGEAEHHEAAVIAAAFSWFAPPALTSPKS